MSTILVTGGAGYIGSHACKALADHGHVPITVDNFARGHREAVRYGPLEVGDITDGPWLRSVFARHQIDAVMHFAALSFVGESVDEPHTYWRNNVVGSLTLLDAMRESGIDRLVFSSTCATYGGPQALPLTEAHPRVPVSPYGRSKLAVEHMIEDSATAHGLRAVVFRYFNAAGADPAGELGEAHDPEPHLIPRALAVAAGDLDMLEVHGTDYPTTDGTCIRDYVHVSDLAEAHVLGVEHLMKGGTPAVLNLGTGRGVSVRAVIAAAEAVTGRPIAVRYGPRRPGDPAELVADPSRAQAVLGWAPLYPDIATQIAHAWQDGHPSAWRYRA